MVKVLTLGNLSATILLMSHIASAEKFIAIVALMEVTRDERVEKFKLSHILESMSSGVLLSFYHHYNHHRHYDHH